MSIKLSHKTLWCDHNQHVKLFNRKLKKSLSNNTRWTRDDNGSEQCLVWTGAVRKGRQSPVIKLNNGQHYNAITQYQRIYAGVHLPVGHVWSFAECGNSCCIRHRKPVTVAEFTSNVMDTLKHDPVFKRNAALAKRKASPTTITQVQKLHALKADGLSIRKAAAQVGVPFGTAAGILRGDRWGDIGASHNGISHIASQLLGARA